jgi:hypothetical protein
VVARARRIACDRGGRRGRCADRAPAAGVGCPRDRRRGHSGACAAPARDGQPARGRDGAGSSRSRRGGRRGQGARALGGPGLRRAGVRPCAVRGGRVGSTGRRPRRLRHEDEHRPGARRPRASRPRAAVHVWSRSGAGARRCRSRPLPWTG